MASNPKKQMKEGGKRRLIIHFGVQKTGSTSIQRYLKQNADLLDGRLIVRTPDYVEVMRPLGQSAIQFSLGRHDADIAFKIAFEDLLESLPGGELPVLISHENIAGAMPGNGGETGLYPMLPKIAQLLEKWARKFDTEFVLYTRQMDEWKSSVWAQAVRTDKYTGTYATFLNETKHIPGWDDLAERIADVIGTSKLTCFTMADEPDAYHPAAQLLRHIGFSEAQLNEFQPLNGFSMQQLNSGSTEFLRQLNQLDINPAARRKVAALVANTQDIFNAEHRPEGTL